jgi:predicted hydrolase (HD superfamily)
MLSVMTMDEARELMQQWTASPALRVHMEAVAACMGAYAEKLQADQRDRWIVCGLVHDMDYEKHPSPEENPRVGVDHLRSLGVDEEVLTAVLGHADYTNTPRETPMAKTLFAVDELCGFLVACTLVTPSKRIDEVRVPSVKKKLKRADFARNVNRDDIVNGAAELGVDLDEHIAFCLDAMVEAREPLGL